MYIPWSLYSVSFSSGSYIWKVGRTWYSLEEITVGKIGVREWARQPYPHTLCSLTCCSHTLCAHTHTVLTHTLITHKHTLLTHTLCLHSMLTYTPCAYTHKHAHCAHTHCVHTLLTHPVLKHILCSHKHTVLTHTLCSHTNTHWSHAHTHVHTVLIQSVIRLGSYRDFSFNEAPSHPLLKILFHTLESMTLKHA